MAKEYDQKRTNFADRLKNAPTAVQMQEVNPVANRNEPPPEEQVQLNAWIPKSLMKKLKAKALDEEKSIKTCLSEALENYLNIDRKSVV